jgi:hypothetical protein
MPFTKEELIILETAFFELRLSGKAPVYGLNLTAAQVLALVEKLETAILN